MHDRGHAGRRWKSSTRARPRCPPGTAAVRARRLPFGMVLGRRLSGSLRGPRLSRGALSLRGHGGSSSDKSLHRCSMADFVEDVDAVALTLEAPPVLIGHSIRGFIVQHYLGAPRRGRCAHGIDAPEGARGIASGHAESSAGAHYAPMFGPEVIFEPPLTREHLFSVNTPQRLLTLRRRSSPRAGARSGSTRWSGYPSPRRYPHRCSSWVARTMERSPTTRCRDRPCLPRRGRTLPGHGAQHDARPGLAGGSRADRELAGRKGSLAESSAPDVMSLRAPRGGRRFPARQTRPWRALSSPHRYRAALRTSVAQVVTRMSERDLRLRDSRKDEVIDGEPGDRRRRDVTTHVIEN